MAKYTAKEAAEKMGYSYCHFMQLIREGRFQYHRISERRIFFTDEDIQASLDGWIVHPRSKAQVMPAQKPE